MKKYILISDFSLTSNNRGTAALGYGAISFLREKGYLTENHVIVNIIPRRNPFAKSHRYKRIVQGNEVEFYDLNTTTYEYRLLLKTGHTFWCSALSRMIANLTCVAALNGGDGFSDIYGNFLYKSRLPYSYIAMKTKVPLIILPQTIGPFKNDKNLAEAIGIIKYAKEVYVRDNKFIDKLNSLGIKYKLTRDLSAYMQPEAWNINVLPNSIGINVSGLAYSNQFLDTAGQFEVYPLFIDSLINKFRSSGKTIYLIPHSYNTEIPEENNDDMVACKQVYESLQDKSNVIFVDKNLISPQVKYLISKMSFFIGTRMHANFAAIFTGVPVFGLAYSYKFVGAFEANGLSKDQCLMINNMKESDIVESVNYIYNFYLTTIK